MPPEALGPTPPQSRSAHIGVHTQKQPGLSYVGVVLPVGRILAERMRGLADIADRFGSGTIRLTVWQNLLISDIPDDRVAEALAAIEALGLGHTAGPLRTGLVACTGNAGCKFAASNTKGHANALVEWLEPRIAVDAPVNIHLTGCHNSCAQHYIADIGLLGAKVERGEDMVEGYDLHVGGGAGANQAIGRLIRPAVAADDLPPLVLTLLQTWMAERAAGEGFQAWSAGKSDEAPGNPASRETPHERAGARHAADPGERAVLPGAACLAERLPGRAVRRRPRAAARHVRGQPGRREEEDFPWHDPALEMDERLALADGKPFERQLMAAMAQLDCGQCGYLCQTYAEALASGTETSAALCVPGAKPTSKKVKELLADRPADAVAMAPRPSRPPHPPCRPGCRCACWPPTG